VHKDEVVTAFHDIHPRAPTHILIVPNIHLESLADVRDERGLSYVAECLKVARDLAEREGLHNGYRVLTNVGREGGQAVYHLHFHLLGGRRLGPLG